MERGESLSLTYFPGHSTSKMHLKRGSNSPNKLSDRPPKDPTVVNIARKVNIRVRKRYDYPVAPKHSLSLIPRPNNKVE
jgi:hypothetical protein